MSPYTVWRQESKDHKQKIIWKTSRYFSSHLVLIFILQRLISAGSGSGQHNNKTSSNPLNSFIRVSTPDHLCVATVCTGWPGCLVLRQGAVNQLFFGVFLMFLACLDHAWWAQFHLGILGPQEWKKSSEILTWKKVRFQGWLKLTYFLIS